MSRYPTSLVTCSPRTKKDRHDQKIHASISLFGRQSSDKLIERVVLTTKTVIFRNSKNGKNQNIKDVQRALFKQLRIEEYQAMLNQKEEEFIEVWEPVYEELYATYSPVSKDFEYIMMKTASCSLHNSSKFDIINVKL